MKFLEGKSLRAAKRFFVAVIGFTLLIVGTAMIVLPGPALIIIPLGAWPFWPPNFFGPGES